MDKTQIQQDLEENPGDPKFIEYADLLVKEGDHMQAIEVCLAGLSANPAAHGGRLILAQAFFERGFYPFAVKELKELNTALPENETVAKLLERISPSSSVSSEDIEETVAESDFDLDILEAIGDDED